MVLQKVFLVTSIFVLAACQSWVSGNRLPDVTPTGTALITAQKTRSAALDMSLDAFRYLEGALDIIQNYSIKRQEIDWQAYRKEVYQRARGARLSEDVYPAIEFALSELHDGHSHFLPPEQEKSLENQPVPEIKGDLFAGKVGYIDVPAYGSSNPDRWTEYATTMQEEIRAIDQNSPCGWIVDLRNNTGGSMFVMVVGIGPILGEGYVESFVYPDGRTMPLGYENGALIEEVKGEQMDHKLIEDAYQLKNPNPMVAVLINERTASAGEVVVVAFEGRPGTRFFGFPTAGATTAVSSYELSDGAVLALADSYYADRTGRIYDGSIRPDEIIFDLRSAGIGDPDQDPVLPAAMDWLLSQKACN